MTIFCFFTITALAPVASSQTTKPAEEKPKQEEEAEKKEGKSAKETAKELREKQKKAHLIICGNNIKQIFTLATIYAEDRGGKFPFVKKKRAKAYEAFNLLIEQFGEDMEPRLFICPADTKKKPAKKDKDGKFRLTAKNCSYLWNNNRIRNSDASETIVCACTKHDKTQTINIGGQLKQEKGRKIAIKGLSGN